MYWWSGDSGGPPPPPHRNRLSAATLTLPPPEEAAGGRWRWGAPFVFSAFFILSVLFHRCSAAEEIWVFPGSPSRLLISGADPGVWPHDLATLNVGLAIWPLLASGSGR
jgi:hypothetical protein